MDIRDEEIAKIMLRLQRSDDMLEKLSNVVRGPLYSIMELARIARKENMSADQASDYLRIIEKSGRSMNESINDIMALRQIYMDNVHIYPQRINMADLLNGLKSDLEKSLDSHSISFSVSDQNIMDITVLADYNVILNTSRKLVKSLITAALPKKNLKFSIDKVSETDNALTLKFSICFGELSFTNSQIEGLTAPFDVLKNAVEKGNEPTDTRFIIIRYFMHAMGSDVVSVSEKDDGSVVISMDIPFTIVDKKAFSKTDIDRIDFTGKRILVADDDTVNLKIIEKLLRDKNAEFITVRDGEEALHTFRNEHGRFDLILLDIIMPDISGLDVARRIRATYTIPNARTVPIIAMTVNSLHEHYFETKDAGMNAHLVKPVEPDRLYATIAEFLT